MSTAQILALGAIAGLTIFIGLPIGRMHGLDAWLKCFLSSTATGILLFLLWDVLSGAVEPVEDALTAGRDGRFAPLATEPEVPSWSFLALLGVIGGAPTFFGTLLGQAWVNESVSVAFLALAGGSVLHFVVELLNVSRALGPKTGGTLW